jgi:hypothetical protein
MEANGLYKIGKTDNIDRRYKQIRANNPTLILIGISEIPEIELHNRYSRHRILAVNENSGKTSRTEWFRIPEFELEELINLFTPYLIEESVESIDYSLEIDNGLEIINDIAKELLDNFNQNSAIEFLDSTYKTLKPNRLEKLLSQYENVKKLKMKINEVNRIKNVH